jgi:pimeloyl-ACP methyl ester carboxylesterase
MPTIVLTAGQPQLTPELISSGQMPAEVTQAFADALWAAQMTAQDNLASLFPGGRHIVVPNSTHYIHIDQPQVVIDAIRDVLRHCGRRRPIWLRNSAFSPPAPDACTAP